MALDNPAPPAVILRPGSRRDLEAIYAGLLSRNPDRAENFIAAAQKTLLQLGELPFLGSPVNWTHIDRRLHSLRRWPVGGFRFYQIIYRPLVSNDGVVIFRVLHSSQDAPSRTVETLDEE